MIEIPVTIQTLDTEFILLKKPFSFFIVSYMSLKLINFLSVKNAK